MTSIRPLHDRVIIERIEVDNKTAGGIIIPDAGKKDGSFDAMIIAVGPKVLDVKAGDKVLIHKWDGVEVIVDTKKCLSIKESAIMAIYE